ncbi:MAG: hypothetical protein RSB61_04685 [Clostridia bacterium]
MQFAIEKKGYNKKQVEEFVTRNSNQYEKTMLEQRELIEELRFNNKELTRQLSEFSAKQNNINLALTNAIDKSKQIEYASKIRYCLEGERLKLFDVNWTNYCKNYIAEHSEQAQKEMNCFVTKSYAELLELMSTELNIGEYVNDATWNYENELDRLNALEREKSPQRA